MSSQAAILQIDDHGVVLYGCSIGHTPTSELVLSAVPYEPDRKFQKLDYVRELMVFDGIGLCVLRDISSDLVYAMIFHFERPTWRELDDQDPRQSFRQSIRIGNVTFNPPVPRGIVDRVSLQSYTNISFFFACQGKGAAGLTIGFPLNEARIDDGKQTP